MKKIVLLFFVFLMFSCSSKKVTVSTEKPLYEVLTEQSTGGASFRFYEILTESKEINMLLGDSHLKNKIHPNDINTSNFVILNMGEQPSKGYFIKVKKVEETPDKILIFVEDSKPEQNEIQETIFPYTVVKINSKKEIIVK